MIEWVDAIGVASGGSGACACEPGGAAVGGIGVGTLGDVAGRCFDRFRGELDLQRFANNGYNSESSL